MRFQGDDLRGAEFVDVDLTGALFHNVKLDGARLREANLVGTRISGYIAGLVVNDIEVAPLIQAEMARRYPELALLRPDDAAGLRAAWQVIEDRWAATSARLAATPEALLRQRVDDEWSAVETVRHLVFVTDTWLTRRVLDRKDWWPAGLVPSFITDAAPYRIDPAADPTLDEVLVARTARLDAVRAYVASATDEALNRPLGEGTAMGCLHVLVSEEWEHLRYLHRDLDALGA